MDRTEFPSRARHLALFAALLAGTALAAHATSIGRNAGTVFKAPPIRPIIEVAFVLDTTGSMSGLLEGGVSFPINPVVCPLPFSSIVNVCA